MVREKRRAFGRSLADLGTLWEGEKVLLASVRAGEPVEFGRRPPDEAAPNNKVRAEFIRFLALGGDDDAPVHEHGVMLQGAWIEGALDLEEATIVVRVALLSCSLAEVRLRGARLRSLSLRGTHLKGAFLGEGFKSDGDIGLDDGFRAETAIILTGAVIGGSLCCQGAVLSGDSKLALQGDRVTVSGSVFLRKGFSATGEVRLVGSTIAAT